MDAQHQHPGLSFLALVVVLGLLLYAVISLPGSPTAMVAAISALVLALVAAWSTLQAAQGGKVDWPAALVRVLCCGALAAVTATAAFSSSHSGMDDGLSNEMPPGFPGAMGSGPNQLELMGQLAGMPSAGGSLPPMPMGASSKPGMAELQALANAKEKIPALVTAANEALAKQDYGQAGDVLTEALALADTLGSAADPQRSNLVGGIVKARLEQGRVDEAVAVAKSHVARLQSRSPVDHKDLGGFCDAMGNLLGTAERYADSAGFLGEATTQLEAAEAGPEVLAPLRAKRALSLWLAGQRDQGRKELQLARDQGRGLAAGSPARLTIEAVIQKMGVDSPSTSD